MNKKLRVVQHVRQSDAKRNCGAACISMIFRHYNKRGKMDDITNEISIKVNGNAACGITKMVNFINSKGFKCCAVAVKNVKETIRACRANNIEVIVSYHEPADNSGGHFSLVADLDDENVYLNDPSKKSDSANPHVKISFAELEERMRVGDSSNGEMIIDGTCILVSSKTDARMNRAESPSKSGEIIVTEYFDVISEFVGAVLVAEVDKWWVLSNQPQPPAKL